MNTKPKRQLIIWRPALVVLLGVAGLFGWIYVKSHPLVFNESFFEHAHCIAQTGIAFRIYAADHQGRYPYSTNGYGNALLELAEEGLGGFLGPLTGPGYGTQVFEDALKNHTHVPESQCGRVYVQGLNEHSNPEIAMLFDKLASPSDHCHLFRRIWAPSRREVCLVDGSHQSVRAEDWPVFAKEQIDLLVKEGFERRRVELCTQRL